MWLAGKISAALAVLCLLALPAAAQTLPPKLPFTLKLVGPGVYAAINENSNAGFIVGSDSVLVVDAFFEPGTARALLSEIRRITPKPIRYLVNTHYHVDHVMGDPVFKEAGAAIVAHRNVRAWIRPENLRLMNSSADASMKQHIAELPLPDQLIDGPTTLMLGNRRVEIRPVEGHTGGDLVVSVPDAKVLFCGDLLWRMPPDIEDGAVRKWISTEQSFEALPDAASMVFVPGHGAVSAVKDVAMLRGYLTDLQSLTEAGRKAGLKGDDLASDVTAKLQASHPDYPTPTRVLKREVTFMEQELDGTKRVPQPAP